jgi:hypothetical protein
MHSAHTLVCAQARLAGDWFPINERDMAVTISVVARSVRRCSLRCMLSL